MDSINTKITVLILLIATLLTSCHMGDRTFMSEKQQRELKKMYDSLQQNHRALMAASETDTLPDHLKNMYAEIQSMHQQMDDTHRGMMARNMDRHMEGERMMSGGMGMYMYSHMSGEWYSQMLEMHKEMAGMHQRMGKDSLAEMNRTLSRKYEEMMDMLPRLDEPTDVPFNSQGDPDLLNGERLYVQNCASCHGEDGQGVSDVFPPVTNTKWITASKTTPIRILLHGLSGPVDVNGQTYNGNMPSFKARLSAAEIAAILNYLRGESDSALSKISQEDVIKVGKANSQRLSPWQAEELQPNANIQE